MIRAAHDKDLPALTDIFNQAITDTDATCYFEPRSADDRRTWWQAHQNPRYPILVAESGGVIAGYASLSSWIDGPAYDRTAEASVFLRLDARGQGMGEKLLRALLAEAARLEHHAIVARVWNSNAASLALCRKCGFETVGVQREVGWRRGAWEDCVILQYTMPPPIGAIDNMLNIGIVGTGGRGIGAFGAMIAARGDAHVAALADTNPVRLAAAARSLPPPVAVYSDASTLAAHPGLDAVIVTTPDFRHAEHVIAALRAGVRHVLVDKPLATTTHDCLRVAEAAKETGGHVAIGFNLRHLPLVRRIKEVIEDGLMGDLMLIENQEFYDGGRTYMARWNRRREWSGGLWIHKGCHDFDVFNWWNARGAPVRVAAFAGNNALRPDKIPFLVAPEIPVGPHCRACAYQDVCPDYAAPDRANDLFSPEAAQADGYWKDDCIFLSDKDTHDNGIALVEYDNNVRASHSECFVCNFTDRRYTLVGDRGTLMASLAAPTRLEFRPRWGQNQIIDVPDAGEGGHGGADPRLLEDFLTSVRGGPPAEAGLSDGLRAVAVGEAAEIAWRERRMVTLDELTGL